MQQTTTDIQRPVGLARYLRPIRKIAATSAVLAGAVAWTSTLDTPLKRQPADAPSVVEQLAARVPSVTPMLPSLTGDAVSLAKVLEKHTKDAGLAQRIAAAVVSEGRKKGIEPTFLVGLMITENAKFDPTAKSNVGATGLMQVMPMHEGKYGCASSRLDDVEGNICHGVQILADFVKRTKSLDQALLRYNGCVRGSNTPRCHTYPSKVRKHVTQVKREMNAVARTASAA
jgi:soluble lytic murein transglycosylase-like protein